jgi:hypothetical protein
MGIQYPIDPTGIALIDLKGETLSNGKSLNLFGYAYFMEKLNDFYNQLSKGLSSCKHQFRTQLNT